jgi:hypothetical protein
MYRACILDQDGHIVCMVKLDCADDAAARQMAARMVLDHDIEVWRGDRKVAVIYAKRYRIYFYDTNGRLISPAMIISADSDAAAIAEANRRIGNMGAELWAGDRIVKEFAAKH